jgi:hypothetical protein
LYVGEIPAVATNMREFINILILIGLCLTIGCSTTNFSPKSDYSTNKPETDGIIEIDEIYVVVSVYPLNGATIGDKTYVLPTKRWIQTIYANYLAVEAYSKTYKIEAFDCENFSLNAQNIASLLGATGQYQLAIGEFYFIQDLNNRAHAVNFFLYKEQNDIKIGFIEPQTGQIINLSEKEISSCLYWRI